MRETLAPWWLLLPACLFVAAVAAHDRLRGKRRGLEAAAEFYRRGIERLEGAWEGQGDPGEDFADETHLYAADLDLFGTGSLFELICRARSGPGRETLAAWLKSPAPAERIRERQEAVGELRAKLDLREDLAVLGPETQTGVAAAALSAWAAGAPILPGGLTRAAATLFAGTATAALISWWLLGIGPSLFLAMVVHELVYTLVMRARVKRVLESADSAGRRLSELAGTLVRIEGEVFRSPLLRRIQREWSSSGVRASTEIARLRRLLVLLDSQRNQLFAPVAGLLLWRPHLAYALEAWRLRCGGEVAGWLRAMGEIEALASLAGYAYEHPGDPFPEIVERRCFEARELGHPLIPPDRCVRSSVRLDDSLRVLVVSGSNMSGKSTLLRTVGTNAALALAGAPVCAQALRVSPMAIGASIRIMDSLREGSSRFYAEITRLRGLMDVTEGPLPLLFLLDELLHGTNSHDRRIGAEAVVRELLDRGAMGLLTTHDLALSNIADELAPLAANVHFEDRVEEGRILFDYRLRPGVVGRSNALDLMRSLGLLRQDFVPAGQGPEERAAESPGGSALE